MNYQKNMNQNKFPISCTKFSLLHRDEFTLGFFMEQ